VARYTKDALGDVVRSLREREGWTQERLGREAGYQTGAGVSISRLEGGLLQPSPERFAGIAAALGLTPDELEARAFSRSRADDHAPAAVATPASAGEAGSTSGGAKAPPGQKELNARRKRIEYETGERTRTITELGDAFNEAHERARKEFYLRLVEIAGRVEGSPPLDPTALGDDGSAGGGDDAGNQREAAADAVTPTPSLSAVEVVAGAAAGPAGAAVGRDASNRAALGRAGGATRGTLVLAGIVAVPVGMLFAGGLAYMVKRNRKQRQEFDAQLNEAEVQLAATRPGITALQDILPRAVETLDYIATHGGHAVDRWDEQHATGPTSWDALSQAEQRRYREFVDIADAQIAIVSFDYQDLLITRGGDRDHVIQLADEVLTRSRDAVRAHV
jgi:transcriptional regulator with XRE-family HTH domain